MDLQEKKLKFTCVRGIHRPEIPKTGRKPEVWTSTSPKEKRAGVWDFKGKGENSQKMKKTNGSQTKFLPCQSREVFFM